MVRILLVEDSPAERALVRKTLLLAGHQVVEATTGTQALDLIERAPFDAVVLDMGLPDMPGADVIIAIHQRFTTLPVVALVDPEIETTTLATLVGPGVSPLAKPFAAHDLLAALSRGLDEGKRAIAIEESVIRLPVEETTER